MEQERNKIDILSDVADSLWSASVDVEKVKTLAGIAYDFASPLYTDDTSEKTKAYLALEGLHDISMLISATMDYVEAIKQTVNESHEQLCNLWRAERAKTE